ncbi:hypothetical protein [Deinococcus sonorensis]|uniref:Uncharacterized protein n=2 Tax=Deinococcus sonorensis TaxID=309891 RepID=A0AAU7U5N6_9DEIO
MTNDQTDTTPLGKSVEEVEGEPQLRHPDNRGLVGRLIDPPQQDGQNNGDVPEGVLAPIAHAIGIGNDEPRNPDADRDSSEES